MFRDGKCLAVPGSPQSVEWLESLPKFLRDIVTEDWKRRGIVTTGGNGSAARQVANFTVIVDNQD